MIECSISRRKRNPTYKL